MYHLVQLSRSANCAVVIQGFDLASSVELCPSDDSFMGVEENPQRLSRRVAVDFASFDDVRTGSGPGPTSLDRASAECLPPQTGIRSQ